MTQGFNTLQESYLNDPNQESAFETQDRATYVRSIAVPMIAAVAGTCR